MQAETDEIETLSIQKINGDMTDTIEINFIFELYYTDYVKVKFNGVLS